MRCQLISVSYLRSGKDRSAKVLFVSEDQTNECSYVKLSMPLETSNSLAPDVSCVQVAGQEFAPMSGYWQTLFPSTSARIDGRVPVATSNQYLVATRLNPSKELIVVCFMPKDAQVRSEYDNLIQYLNGKG